MIQTLIEMGLPQSPTPIQTDTTTYEGVVNRNIVTKKLKSTDLRLHWLRCREAQKTFGSTGTKYPTIGVTITQNNIHQYITRQSAPFLHGALIFTAFPKSTTQRNTVRCIFSSGGIYSIPARVYCYPIGLHV